MGIAPVSLLHFASFGSSQSLDASGKKPELRKRGVVVKGSMILNRYGA